MSFFDLSSTKTVIVGLQILAQGGILVVLFVTAYFVRKWYKDGMEEQIRMSNMVMKIVKSQRSELKALMELSDTRNLAVRTQIEKCKDRIEKLEEKMDRGY